MHLELPGIRLESIKDFLKEYLMIVVSILTALGLDAWIEHAHHQQAAHAASAQIEAEIRANLDDVSVALAQDEQRAKDLRTLRDRMIADFRAHVPETTIAQHVQAMTTQGLHLNLRWPTLRHEAWDVAVADQSVSWIEQARMRRYSAAYASQRDMGTNLNTNIALVMNGPRMLDTMTDLRVGDVRPRELLYVTGQMATMLDQAQDGLKVLQKHLRDALVDAPLH